MIYVMLFVTFFKIGLFTIGGGYAMIPLIQTEIVDTQQWLTMDEFTDFVGISEGTPGPFAINIATFSGMHIAGVLGSIVSTLGLVLPSLIIILLIAAVFRNFLTYQPVKNGLSGTRPIVTGLIAAATLRLLLHAIYPDGIWLLTNILLTVFLLIVSLSFKPKPVFMVIIGALVGLLVFGVFKVPLP